MSNYQVISNETNEVLGNFQYNPSEIHNIEKFFASWNSRIEVI